MRRFWYFDVSVCSVDKNRTDQGCVKIVFSLHTARTENPYAPPNLFKRLQFLWIPLRYPSDTPQTTPWHLQGTQHTNRHQQTPPDTPWHRKVLFEYVWHLSLGICCCLLAWHVPWRRLGVSGGCLGVSGGYLSGIYGNWRRSDVLTVWSKNTI